MSRGETWSTLKRRLDEGVDLLPLDEIDLKMLQMLADGGSLRETAEVVYLSQDALKSRRARIHKFLGTWTPAMLVAECMRQGVVK